MREPNSAQRTSIFRELNFKLISTLAVGFVILIVNLISCIGIGGGFTNDSLVSLSICALGATIGWVLGIAISPYDDEEEHKFSSIGKTISAFATGYLISKFDGVLTSLAENIVNLIAKSSTSQFSMSDLQSSRLMGLFCFFLVSIICVYVFRKYKRIDTTQPIVNVA